MVRSASKAERWIVLAAGFVVMSTAGTAFSWSLYTRPLIALFGWSSIQVALGFSFLVVFLAVGAIVGGFAHDRFGPRMVAIAGAVLWGAGSLLAGLGIERFGLWWLYLTYSAIGGIGCGMVYVVPGAAVTKWFPEERGLANGILLCGFGLGSLAFNLIVTSFPAFRAVADAANRFVETRNAGTAAGHALAMSPALDHAGIAVIAAVFFWSGIVFLIVGGLSAMQLHSPPAGYSVASVAAKIAGERDFTPREMLRTRAFYVMWAAMFVNATCGLALFSNAVSDLCESGRPHGGDRNRDLRLALVGERLRAFSVGVGFGFHRAPSIDRDLLRASRHRGVLDRPRERRHRRGYRVRR